MPMLAQLSNPTALNLDQRWRAEWGVTIIQDGRAGVDLDVWCCTLTPCPC